MLRFAPLVVATAFLAGAVGAGRSAEQDATAQEHEMRLLIPTLATVACVSASTSFGQNLLVNGGLEGGTPSACNGFTTLSGGSTAIPGWRVVGPTTIDWNWHNAAAAACCDWAPEGDRTIDLNGLTQDGGAIDQTIATTPGRRYRVSFLALANGCCAPIGTPKVIRVTTGTVQSEHTLLTLWGSSDVAGVECDWTRWTRIEREWTATSDSTVIELRSLVLANAGGVLVDNISVTEVGPRDLLVPSEYATIAAAVAASLPGDRVLIAPGEYPWTPVIVSHQLTIEGSAGALSTRFQGNGAESQPLVECAAPVGQTVVLRNLHLDYGLGIHASSGGLLAERCLFTRNKHGILIEGATASFTGASIHACGFVRNGGSDVEQAGGVGAYVYAQGAPGAALDSCIFIENTAREGGAFHTQFSTSSATNCVFARNVATQYSAGAIARWWGHDAIAITSCDFSGNAANWSGTGNWNCCINCVDCDFAPSADTTTDCDGNAIPDLAELRADPSLDADGNGVLDACEPQPCTGDVDESNSVDGVDLAIILQNWGTPSPKYPRADINGDGLVSGGDLALVLSNWGACP